MATVSDGWRRASGCTANECIEVQRERGGWVLVRNSRQPDDYTVHSPEEWAVFVAGVKAGEFDDLAAT